MENKYNVKKLNFYNWVYKWILGIRQDKETQMDVSQIAAILQGIGFNIQTTHDQYQNEPENDTNEITVEIKCKNSGLFAVMSKQSSTCLCTSQENNLFPQMSKDMSTIVREVVMKLCEMISEKDAELQSAGAWEVDPKISPPIGTSSPIATDKEHILADILCTIKKSAEDALTLLPTKNNTFTKSTVKRVSDIKPSPSTPNLPVKRLDEQLAAKSTSSLSEKKLYSATSKIGSFRKKTSASNLNNPKLKLSAKGSSPAVSPTVHEQKKTFGLIPKNIAASSVKAKSALTKSSIATPIKKSK